LVKKVAITGGIGSGKSTILQYIREMGYETYSCDEIYKEILQSKHYIEEVQKVFPEAVSNEKIDRTVLAQIVFKDAEKRTLLNNISHPLIMQSLLNKMKQSKGDCVFAEVPLLFEGNFESLFDEIIVIKRNFSDRMIAVAERDSMREEDVKNRILSQFDYDSEIGQKRVLDCNAYILYNDADYYSLKKEIENVLLKIKKKL